MKDGRWTEITESQFAWESDALSYLRSRLPDTDPFRAWSNFEFIAGDGSINEVDLLVVSHSRIVLVEIKSRPGKLSGDAGTWTWHREGRPIIEDNPLLLANRKAKKLKSLLQPKLSTRQRRVPFIEPVIFLSNLATKCELDSAARYGVYLGEAAKDDNYPNIMEVLLAKAATEKSGRYSSQIDGSLSKAIAWAMDQIGIRPSQRHRRVGDYELDHLILETDLYQDWEASHTMSKNAKRRVRIYPIALQSTSEERQLLRQAAAREFELLEGIEHPGILRVEQFTEIERGPALVFEHDPDSERLDLFLQRQSNSLAIDERLSLLREISETVAHAHTRKLYHRSLSPMTILISSSPDSLPKVKLFDWQAARYGVATQDGSQSTMAQTLHVDMWSERHSLVYAAPEVLARRAFDGEKLDIFSLGAIAYHLFSGQPPALNVEELLQKLSSGRGLQISSVVDGVLEPVQVLIEFATDPSVEERPGSVDEFLKLLDDVEEKFTEPNAEDSVHPLIARGGDILQGGFLVKRRLGKGSTSIALLAERDGQEGVLKVAATPEHNDRLIKEGEALRTIRHQNIVELYDICEISGHKVLFMATAGTGSKNGTYTLAQRIREEGRLSLDLLQRFGEELLQVIGWLEEKGISHRDIKPDNIGIAATRATSALTPVLFDFSLIDTPIENLHAGTPPYLDPFLRTRKPPRWDICAERFAAAMTLYEMATGQLPSWGDDKSDPSVLDVEVTIDSELFDVAVREGLTGFFAEALAREHTARFDNAEEMRRTWFRVFENIDDQTTTTGHDEGGNYEQALANATEATPLSQLGLSARVLNALDRLGAHTIGELARTPRIRLYRNKGIGQKTVKDIRKLAEAVNCQVIARRSTDAEILANITDIDGEAQTHWSVDRITSRLIGSRLSADVIRILQVLLGITSSSSLPQFASSQDVVTELKVPRAQVRKVILAARERWGKQWWMKTLRDDIALLIDRHAGVMTGRELAEGVLAARGSVAEQADRLRLALASTYAAIEAEGLREGARYVLFRDESSVLVVGTEALAEGYVESSEARARYALKLAACCDELADADPLLAPIRVGEALAAIEAPPGDQPMAPDRVLRLGVRASTRAALSSRMEIYPRGMKAARALRLGAGSLLGPKKLTRDDIEKRIRSRYPEAESLPPQRGKFEALLEDADIALTWNSAENHYARSTHHAVSLSSASTMHRHATETATAVVAAPDVTAAAVLETRICTAVNERRFFVLSVSPKYFMKAHDELESRFNLERVSLEALLLAEMRKLAEQAGAAWDVVLRADDASHESTEWRNLQVLVQRAIPAVEKNLLLAGKPRLLVHLGLLARYSQLQLLDSLRDASGNGTEALGFIVLLPADEQRDMPMIDSVPMPVVLPSQWARIGNAWIRNTHRALAAAREKKSSRG